MRTIAKQGGTAGRQAQSACSLKNDEPPSLTDKSVMGGGIFLSYRKLCFNTIKNAPRGSHFGGVELCRSRDPPQAENPAEQDSIFLQEEQSHGTDITGRTEKNGSVRSLPEDSDLA